MTNETRYWTIDELMEGIEEAPSRERTGYRYSVFSDGACHHFNDRRALRKMVGCTYSKRPRVFRNADKGITIDFDSSK